MNEIIGGTFRVPSTGICITFFGLGQIFLNIIMIFMHNYRTLILFQGYCSIALSISYFFLVESPFYLYKKRSLGAFLKCLTKISKFNNKPEINRQKINEIETALMIPNSQENVHLVCKRNEDDDTLDVSVTNTSDHKEKLLSKKKLISKKRLILKNPQLIRKRILQIQINKLDLDMVESVSSSEKRYILNPNLKNMQIKRASLHSELSGRGNFLDLLICQNLKTFGASILLMSMIYLGYGVSMQINQKLGIKNPYLNGILLGICETGGYFMGAMLSNKLTRRTINIIANSVLLICSFIIIVMDVIYNSESSNPVDRPFYFNMIELSKCYLYRIMINKYSICF